eukprot:TRINITY_DN21318_c0_g1_i1.p2 TRINITY_DN21318_c0_g1~~TRINITY_DN21318_c0_g1_i1.p2  ORF type:complete len:199 (+),score=42.25 TRINITY_DN21318_c0_g1_i1:151-747(+)
MVQLNEDAEIRFGATSTIDSVNFGPAADTREHWLQLSPAEWKKLLSEDEHRVLRDGFAEKPNSSEWSTQFPAEGYFACRACKLPLYGSSAKIYDKAGYPAFEKCFHSKEWESHVEVAKSFGALEIHCKRCRCHLGFVYFGGDVSQTATKERHLVNGIAVRLVPEDEPHGLVEQPVDVYDYVIVHQKSVLTDAEMQSPW